MSSLFGSAGGGPPDRPPSVHGPATAAASSRISTQWPHKISMLPLTLVPTTERVWPEDEALEEQASKDTGREVPRLATPEEARQMASELRVELPDRLLGHLLRLPPNPWLATTEYDYYGLYVPTTFSAAPGITPRRLRLQLRLEDAAKAEPPCLPIACQLYPSTEVVTEITNIGEFKIDLGQAFIKTMWVFWPEMPEVLTARAGGSLDLKKVRARVQAAGLASSRCEWRIADTEIAYNFNPACIVQVPKGAQLAVSAQLYVEARKRIALVFYKNYFRTSIPMRYILRDTDGAMLSADKLPDGFEVTLRQPGVVYSDEPTMFPYVGSTNVYVGPPAVDSISGKAPDISLTEQASPAAFDTVTADAPGQNVKSLTDPLSAYTEKITPELASLVDKLTKLASMLESGLLTREEFDQLKAKLIADSAAPPRA